MPVLSYKYRLYPSPAQTAGMEAMPGAFCELYNACLQQRIEACRRQGKTLRYLDQSNELKAWLSRRSRPEYTPALSGAVSWIGTLRRPRLFCAGPVLRWGREPDLERQASGSPPGLLQKPPALAGGVLTGMM